MHAIHGVASHVTPLVVSIQCVAEGICLDEARTIYTDHSILECLLLMEFDNLITSLRCLL